MDRIKILWADDEIELLKPHILFLTEKGYDVIPVRSGDEALDELKNQHIDVIFLDENMPGLSGLDTLIQIKNMYSSVPVIMITKSEEEQIMEDAIGSKISDYLIKPVNPNQILLALKKQLNTRRLVSEKNTSSYQQQFRDISMQLTQKLDLEEWKELYRKLTYWEMELSSIQDDSMHHILISQKNEANNLFAKYIESNYEDWLSGNEKPLMSPTVLKEKLFPLLDEPEPVFLIVIDNLRYDQWKTIQPTIENLFKVEEDDMYFSILPTTTQYARNSLFSGLMPTEIQKKYPNWWVNEDDEGQKNAYEIDLLNEYLKRYGKQIKTSYHKVLNMQFARKLVDNIPSLLNQNKLNVIVYNFIDMLSHARTELDIIRELAADEKAYRSLTLSWFEHSPLFDILKILSEKRCKVVITTDHGSVKITNPVKVKGDRDISVNLRYKVGRLMDYNPKEVYEVKDASKVFLPKLYVTSPYIFARNSDFFAYPNNYNYYVSYYTNTFQHGGISMEEVIIPYVTLTSKNH